MINPDFSQLEAVGGTDANLFCDDGHQMPTLTETVEPGCTSMTETKDSSRATCQCGLWGGLQDLEPAFCQLPAGAVG